MRTRSVTWNGIVVEAALPEPLASSDPVLTIATVRQTEQAIAALQRFGDRTVAATDVAARLLLRSEGVASSAIEGVAASAADVALAEVTESGGAGNQFGSALWIADNLAVVNDALDAPAPLTTERVLGWHERLMRHDARLDRSHIGAWRDRLGWIGGASPRMAVHVAAAEGDIPALMDDLMAFIARDDIDPIAQAALAHAQFETIHPFADGNGRIGRVMIGWMLSNRLELRYPPPISLQLARDVGGYQAGLTLFRQDRVDAWISWFAGAVMRAAQASADILAQIAQLQDRWRGRLADLRSDAAALRLCNELPAHPVLSALTVAELLGVSRPAAANAIKTLEQRGILTALDASVAGRNPRELWWQAADMLALLGR